MVFSMDRWKGKVAIVTGASAGIGAAIAERLVVEGLQVVGFARRSDRVQELAKKLENRRGKLYAVQVDITKEEDILKGFKWVSENVGPVHILINNAGIGQQTSLTDGDTEKWKKVFDTNVMGLCIATREAVKIMKEKQIEGHIIHINSLAGHRVLNMPEVNVYPASKYAVTALTETLRQELNRLGLKIKITSLSPGLTLTEMLQANNIQLNPLLAKLAENALKAEDIAEAAVHILSTPPHVQIHEYKITPMGTTG